MGIFARLARLIKSNLNDLISRSEDPEKMLNQIVIDMSAQLIEAKKQVASSIADEKRLAKQAEQEAATAAEWERRAMMAVRAADDNLAKEGLARKKEHEQLAEQYKLQWQKQKQAVDSLKLALRALNSKIEEAKRKKNLLIARKKRAEAQKQIQETMSGEVECMRRASALAVRGHRAAHAAFAAGESEFEAHLAYCAAVGQRDEELPYGNIIAYDRGAAVLHYHKLSRSRDVPRRSFLIDAGAQFRGYAADITRTYARDDGEFAALVRGMESIELALCGLVRPGADYRDIHLEAHRLIAGLLHEAGIIACGADEAVGTGLSSTFFPHGIGHLLGLQVHDVAGLAGDRAGNEIPRPAGHPYLRLTRRLEPGFVVTIEPGLYFIDLLLDAARASDHARRIRWDTVERLRPCGGIRVEDDVLCTTGAPENLTRDAFAAA